MQPVKLRAATCDPRYSQWIFKGLNFLYDLQLVSGVALVLFLISILPAANILAHEYAWISQEKTIATLNLTELV